MALPSVFFVYENAGR